MLTVKQPRQKTKNGSATYKSSPQDLKESIVQAIAREDRSATLRHLKSLEIALHDSDDHKHLQYVQVIAGLIYKHGFVNVPHWNDNELIELIRVGAFIDQRGHALFVGPHAPRRRGQNYRARLSAICGDCQEVSIGKKGSRSLLWEGLLKEEQFSLAPIIPSVVAGIFAKPYQEFFVPGSMWRIGDTTRSKTPAILNVEAVRLAAENSAKHAVRAIFDHASAKALTSWLDDPKRARKLIALEYLKHEYGHAAGIGMKNRMERGLFSGGASSRIQGYAIDESRADGVRSQFVEEHVEGSAEEQDLAAVTLIIRILDIIRLACHENHAQLFGDVDILTALRWFEQMVTGGTLYMHRDGRLGLQRQLTRRDERPRSASTCVDEIDLVRVVWPMKDWAARIEAAELTDGHSALSELVLSNRVGERMRTLFKKQLIDPCCLIEMTTCRRYD